MPPSRLPLAEPVATPASRQDNTFGPLLKPPLRSYLLANWICVQAGYNSTDHVVPADQVRDLWRHWGEPRMAWYAGSHLSFLREPDVRLLIDDTLRGSGLVLQR